MKQVILIVHEIQLHLTASQAIARIVAMREAWLQASSAPYPRILPTDAP